MILWISNCYVLVAGGFQQTPGTIFGTHWCRCMNPCQQCHLMSIVRGCLVFLKLYAPAITAKHWTLRFFSTCNISLAIVDPWAMIPEWLMHKTVQLLPRYAFSTFAGDYTAIDTRTMRTHFLVGLLAERHLELIVYPRGFRQGQGIVKLEQ